MLYNINKTKMLKVPLFKWDLYEKYMKKSSTWYLWISYNDIDSSGWIDFKVFVKFLTDNVIKEHKSLSVFKIRDYLGKNWWNLWKNSPIDLWNGKSSPYPEFFSACKVIMPTLWWCEYFLWNVWEWSHWWIDIMLPKWTPLPAFLWWEIVKADLSSGYGNCVVIKANHNWQTIFLCYEHLDSIKAWKGQTVKQWDIIGYAGTTWNSTQYHLHFQVDNAKAPYHPYYAWWSNANLKLYTIDPLVFLRQIYKLENEKPNNSTNVVPTPTAKPVAPTAAPTSKPVNNTAVTPTKPIQNKPTNTSNNDKDDEYDILNKIIKWLDDSTTNEVFLDMPKEKVYQEAIMNLYNKKIIKWWNSKILPNDNMQRYELALILYRISLLGYYKNLKIINSSKIPYIDLNIDDMEVQNALEYLYKYWIMVWKDNTFMPFNEVNGEEIIAVLWRSIYNLNDSNSGHWYDTYINDFVNKKYIEKNWKYIWQPVPRKEIFRLLSLILK